MTQEIAPELIARLKQSEGDRMGLKGLMLEPEEATRTSPDCTFRQRCRSSWLSSSSSAWPQPIVGQAKPHPSSWA